MDNAVQTTGGTFGSANSVQTNKSVNVIGS